MSRDCCSIGRTRGGRRSWPSSTASSALASFPPILVGVFGVTALYAARAGSPGDGTSAGPLASAGWWSAATVALAGLVAAYYLPAVALHRAMPHVAAIYAGRDSRRFRS